MFLREKRCECMLSECCTPREGLSREEGEEKVPLSRAVVEFSWLLVILVAEIY